MKYPKAHKIKRTFAYTSAEAMSADHLKKKFRRIELELEKQKVEQEKITQKKVRQLKTA